MKTKLSLILALPLAATVALHAATVRIVQTNSAGTTWANGPTPGLSIPLTKFFVAKPSDSAATINAALRSGRNLIVTPVAAYLSSIRSIVVGPAHLVRVQLVDGPPAIVSIDGRDDYPVEAGDAVEIRALTRPIRFIEPMGALPFWDLLRQKAALLPA